MTESYYVFFRYSLFRISVIAFTIPFVICLLITIINYNVYQYHLPYHWFLVTFIPFLFVGYKIKIRVKEQKLMIERCFINVILLKTHSALRDENSVKWIRSNDNEALYELYADGEKTGLIIDL